MNDQIVYQIYPKSFKDSNSDGIGDIKGIISKLDYIKGLGVDFIWLTPIFKSPQNDNGYDVSDYYQIDSIFGTIDDLRELVTKAKTLGLKIMFDMVFNHTSTQHIWFKKALEGDKYYQDFYYFTKDMKNWKSKFGDSAFEYVEKLDKYYLHLFDKSQADLNWNNKNVRNELYKVINYWIDFGIKGFRFDVINLIGKNKNLGGEDIEGYTDLPVVQDYLKEMRQETYLNNKEILTVGEMSSASLSNCLMYANKQKTQLDTVFNFYHLKVDYKNAEKWTMDYFDFIKLKKLLQTWQVSFHQTGSNMALFWSNHDQPRIASRFVKAKNLREQLRKNKMLAMAMYLQKGTIFIFQGEEIGAQNNVFDSTDFNDIESINYLKSTTSKDALTILNQKSRDHGRVVMPWNAEQYFGFSDVKPWSFISNSNPITVEQNLLNKNSTLNFYQELIKLRKTDSILINGSYQPFLEYHPYIYSFKRRLNNKTYLVLCNFFDVIVNIENLELKGDIILSNDKKNSLINIEKFGAIVVNI